MGHYSKNLIPNVTRISSDTVADATYVFDTGNISNPLTFFLDGFHFVDGAGAPVTASAGTVLLEATSDGSLWRSVTGGSFAADIDPADLTPPNGFGLVTQIRITLASVADANGFRGSFVKGDQ